MRKLHWSLLKRVYRLRSRYAVYRRQGHRWLLDNRNWVDQQLIIRRPYEVGQLARCGELLEQYQITHFFDIGANFGLYSVLLSDALSLQTIEAFEPLPRNQNQMAANLYLNGLDAKVSLNACALGDRKERKALFVDKHSTGVSTLDPEGMARDKNAYDARVDVQTDTLDNLFDTSGQKVLVKIDVEGAELQVLDGMRRFLSANQVWIQVETTPNTRAKVNEFMRQANYRQLGRLGADSYFSKETE